MATRKKAQQQLHLNESERALLFMVVSQSKESFDASRTDVTEEDLRGLKFVRENWTQEEIQQKGLAKDGVVTSFDKVAKKAESKLAVDAPFADGIQKWQLPIDLPGFRVVMTRFPPGTVVKAHAHPSIPGFSRCGQLRVVVKGSITYDGKVYNPGDWFYIPGGVAYSFVTDPKEETLESYYYQYNGIAQQPLRFSNFSFNPT